MPAAITAGTAAMKAVTVAITAMKAVTVAVTTATAVAVTATAVTAPAAAKGTARAYTHRVITLITSFFPQRHHLRCCLA